MAPVAQAVPFLAGGCRSSPSAPAPANARVPMTRPAWRSQLDGRDGWRFHLTSGATPGVVGGFEVDGTSGDFNVLYGLTGTIKDFTFNGAQAHASYPVPPITQWQKGFAQVVTSPCCSFDMLSVESRYRTHRPLTLDGTGLFHLVDTPTPGMFYFGADDAGDTFSFTASETVVPEPGSVAPRYRPVRPRAPFAGGWRRSSGRSLCSAHASVPKWRRGGFFRRLFRPGPSDASPSRPTGFRSRAGRSLPPRSTW